MEINVVIVYPDGYTKTYGKPDKHTGARPFVSARRFNNYGQALLHAQEFEDKQKQAGKYKDGA